MKRKGFSLIELQISLLIGAILMATIGVVSGMTNGLFIDVLKEANLYDDVVFGFKLLQNKVRTSSTIAVINQASLSSEWVSDQLVVNNGGADQAFGLYQASGSTNKDFVYLKDKTNINQRDIIVSVPDGDIIVNFSLSQDSLLLDLDLSGTKDEIPFMLNTTITRRAP